MTTEISTVFILMPLMDTTFAQLNYFQTTTPLSLNKVQYYFPAPFTASHLFTIQEVYSLIFYVNFISPVSSNTASFHLLAQIQK
jgi:hypothetical protein